MGRFGLGLVWVSMFAVGAIGLAGCESLDFSGAGGQIGGGGASVGGGIHTQKGGPPPHAPAHGYRAKHHRDDVELVYDSGLGVYAVVGYDNHYHHNDVYFRYANDLWQMSVSIGGPWGYADDRKVPRKLKNKHGGKGKGKSQGKGKGKNQ